MIDKDVFIVVTWPDVQEFFELDEFDENSILINKEELYNEYGSSAYLIRKIWLDEKENNKSLFEKFGNIFKPQ